MAYCTPAQLAVWPGIRVLAQCATPEGARIVADDLLLAIIQNLPTTAWADDEVAAANQAHLVILACCEQASSEVDVYVLLRMPTVPMPQPQVLQIWASKIAIYKLHRDMRINLQADSQGQHPVHADYQQTLKDMAAYRDGKIGLGISGDTNSPSAELATQFQSQPTVWTRGWL